jgi:hypothetical protein
MALAWQFEFGPWTALKGRLWRFPATNDPRTADQRAPILDGKTLSRPMSLYVPLRQGTQEIRLPLAKLSDDDRAFIDALLAKTTARPEILAAVRERFPQGRRGGVG